MATTYLVRPVGTTPCDGWAADGGCQGHQKHTKASDQVASNNKATVIIHDHTIGQQKHTHIPNQGLQCAQKHNDTPCIKITNANTPASEAQMLMLTNMANTQHSTTNSKRCNIKSTIV